MTAPTEDPALRTAQASPPTPPPRPGRAEKRVNVHPAQSQRARSIRMRAHLHQRAPDRARRPQHLARDRAGGHPHRGLSRRRPPAAAIIAHAVFQLIGQVGMAGPELLLDRAIIAGSLVDVLDHQRDRRPGGHAVEHARQDPDLIRLLPLRGEFRLARAARSSQGWISASDSGIRGGQPSTTQPIAGPWLSPQVVTRNRWPNVFGSCQDHLRSRCQARPDVSCRRRYSRNRRDAPRRSRQPTRSDSRYTPAPPTSWIVTLRRIGAFNWFQRSK